MDKCKYELILDIPNDLGIFIEKAVLVDEEKALIKYDDGKTRLIIRSEDVTEIRGMLNTLSRIIQLLSNLLP